VVKFPSFDGHDWEDLTSPDMDHENEKKKDLNASVDQCQ